MYKLKSGKQTQSKQTQNIKTKVTVLIALFSLGFYELYCMDSSSSSSSNSNSSLYLNPARTLDQITMDTKYMLQLSEIIEQQNTNLVALNHVKGYLIQLKCHLVYLQAALVHAKLVPVVNVFSQTLKNLNPLIHHACLQLRAKSIALEEYYQDGQKTQKTSIFQFLVCCESLADALSKGVKQDDDINYVKGLIQKCQAYLFKVNARIDDTALVLLDKEHKLSSVLLKRHQALSAINTVFDVDYSFRVLWAYMVISLFTTVLFILFRYSYCVTLINENIHKTSFCYVLNKKRHITKLFKTQYSKVCKKIHSVFSYFSKLNIYYGKLVHAFSSVNRTIRNTCIQLKKYVSN